MERIKLSQDERRLLRNIQAGVGYRPEGMGAERVARAASALERHGLIRVAWCEVHRVEDARLTEYGTAYLLANPHLRGPIDWRWVVTTAIAAGTLLVGIAALLVGCRLLGGV